MGGWVCAGARTLQSTAREMPALGRVGGKLMRILLGLGLRLELTLTLTLAQP